MSGVGRGQFAPRGRSLCWPARLEPAAAAGRPGLEGGSLSSACPPPPPPSTDTGHLPSFPHLAAPVSPRSGSQVQLLFGSPRGESEHRGVAARGSADLRTPRPAGGPGRTWPPPSAPAGGASRSAFPHRPFRQGQTVSIPGLGLPGPSGFTSDKWEFSGAVSPASPEDGAFRAPRASVLPGKSSSPSARPSLLPLTFIFQVPPFL